MTSQESFEEKYPYWAAAQKAAETVKPGNELQEAAASAIKALAFRMEVSRAFPETVEPVKDTQIDVTESAAEPAKADQDHRDINDTNAVREGLSLRVSLSPDELASE